MKTASYLLSLSVLLFTISTAAMADGFNNSGDENYQTISLAPQDGFVEEAPSIAPPDVTFDGDQPQYDYSQYDSE